MKSATEIFSRRLLTFLIALLCLKTPRVMADSIPGSGIADFYYNQSTGALILDTDGQTTVSMLVEGPEAVSINRFAGSDPATGTNWIQGYFAGKEQWIELTLAGVQGAFKIATYAPGFNQGDFLSVEYGTAGGGIEHTQVTGLFFAADFDRDNEVDGGDLSRWQNDYGVNELSDANNDGSSNGRDFLLWQREFGSGTNVSVAVQCVPEPSSVLLFLSVWVIGWCVVRPVNGLERQNLCTRKS